MTKCSLWKGSGNNRPTPSFPEKTRAGRRLLARPAGALPSALPPAFSGGAGLGNTHPFTPQTPIQACLPPGSVDTQPGPSVRAQGQAQTNSGEPEPEQPAMRWHGLTQGREELAFMERDGPETLLFHAWGGPRGREGVPTSVS